jgi:putative ABC transport system permease protein
MGIRLVLGADPKTLLSLVMRHGLKLTLAGLLFGIFASLLLGRTLQALLFEVEPTDPATFIAVALVVGLAALISSYLPGRDAARTEPAVALRQE